MSTLTESRSWLEARYRNAGLPVPDFRWVERGDARTGTGAPSSALVLEDRELRLLLLLLDLDPAAGPEGLAGQVRADLQNAWALRSACLPSPGPGLPGGAAAWRVAVHWLGTAQQMSAWKAAILYVRQDGSLMEEIPVNAAFRTPGEPMELCLGRSGFPCLLLATRQAFRRDAKAMELWASADLRVREALADLDTAFANLRPRAIAREIQAMAQAEPGAGTALPSGPPRRLGTLTVRNVRGVRDLTLEPWPGHRAVQAWVVSGPNGSGKSSLAEAVSLRAFGTSRGLCGYLKDPDVNRARSAKGYVGQYLSPLGGGVPACGLDGSARALEPAPDLAQALEALAGADGTLAAQGSAPGFLDLPGDELGARMARSSSPLANRLEAWVEAGRKGAGEARAALARRHGVSTSIRLFTTFQEKIARSRLGAALLPLPPVAAGFLACRAALPGPAGAAASALLAAWDPASRLDRAVQSLLHLDAGTPEEAEGALLPLFEARSAQCRDLLDQIGAFRTRVGGLPAPPLGLAAQASRWADWLARPESPGAAPVPPPEAPYRELEGLLAERAALAEAGGRTRPHRDHLEQALAFIREHWQDRHLQDCPTCGSHLPGPVGAAAAALLAEAEGRLAAQREAYAELTRRIRQLENRPRDPSSPICPVPLEARQQVQTVSAALLGPCVSAEELLRAPGTRSALEKLLAYAEAPPGADLAVPEPQPAAAACAGEIIAAFGAVEQALAEPDAWEAVARELTRRLAQVVGEHLPATLEALWRELAACLSPAPWLLPAPPSFQPRTSRGANRVEVVLEAPDGEPRLARHLLNDAQRSTLGLAWTFCQHLVQARFRHAWMLLDDPAQAMDQPAFRALCRFLATLLGLYEASGQPFTLVLLLNQEDRAMDAARETGQGLILLGWTGRQEDAAVKRIGIFAEGVRCPQPEDLFGRTAG